MENYKVTLELKGDETHVKHLINIFMMITEMAPEGKIKDFKRVSEPCAKCGIMLKTEELKFSILDGHVCPQCYEKSNPAKKKK